ncbi:MAG: alpha,alpha-trehalase [Verrucomicrobiaceae bacterium]|nr:MAG: alpha,alpha-trehalase [Verrucomicrobiaceae bacterium]
MGRTARGKLPRAKQNALENHVSRLWPELIRSTRDAFEAVKDVKLEADAEIRRPLYVSASENPRRVREKLRKSLGPDLLRGIEIRVLSGAPEQISEHGLVYLPGRYVVPGGRFNEMYGWDSYFIALGLIAEGRSALAKSIADQQLYQVKHYGTVLNCNRTYCLTRSHPPFLGRLVLAVYRATGNLEWLRGALPHVERYHAYWTSMPQFIPGLGLSRYHAFGDGPAPEALHGELDSLGRNHYERLKAWLRTHGEAGISSAQVCYDTTTDSLTLAAYKDDRTVRESGFDLTGRFGPCGMGIRDYAPVCLNTLLWRMEMDIAEIRKELDASPQSIEYWESNADDRAAKMRHHFWDEKAGLFLDWQLSTGKRRHYPYATTFWPLWAGWATPAQAARVMENLSKFETPHGLLTSTLDTGCQWDAPFMWAPLVMLAVQGVDRYGFTQEAARISNSFLTTLSADFERTGGLFEKYNALTGSSDVGEHITFGYPTNEPGFGWTNASVRILSAFARGSGAT